MWEEINEKIVPEEVAQIKKDILQQDLRVLVIIDKQSRNFKHSQTV